jgi:hypothetical protein
VLGVVVSVAWHPITLDFGNMQKKQKCAVGILLKIVSSTLSVGH